MAQELMEYLEGRSTKQFAPVPHYFPDGDFVTFYTSDERCYAERVDQLLTVYYSVSNKQMIGCKIKGVCKLLATVRQFGVVVQDQGIQLGIFFLAGALDRDMDPVRRRYYQDLTRLAKDFRLDSPELRALAA